MAYLKLPSQGRLVELLNYNPQSGELSWKKRQGVQEGKLCKRAVAVDNKKYLSHRLIWVIMTGEDPLDMQIDHRDRNPQNNKWNNLRIATQSQNLGNTQSHSDSAVFYKGVSYYKNGDYIRYRARIHINGKEKTLGYYKTAEEAYEAYSRASIVKNRDFHCTGSRPHLKRL